MQPLPEPLRSSSAAAAASPAGPVAPEVKGGWVWLSLRLGMLILWPSVLVMLVLRKCQAYCMKITSRARVLCLSSRLAPVQLLLRVPVTCSLITLIGGSTFTRARSLGCLEFPRSKGKVGHLSRGSPRMLRLKLPVQSCRAN